MLGRDGNVTMCTLVLARGRGEERLRCCERRLEADVHPDAGDEDRRDRAILA